MKYAEFAATTKQRRRELAKAHDKEMRSSYGHEIEECVKSTVVYGPDAPVVFPLERQTEFHLTANDTVAEIFNDYGGNCCVLNFAPKSIQAVDTFPEVVPRRSASVTAPPSTPCWSVSVIPTTPGTGST